MLNEIMMGWRRSKTYDAEKRKNRSGGDEGLIAKTRRGGARRRRKRENTE